MHIRLQNRIYHTYEITKDQTHSTPQLNEQKTTLEMSFHSIHLGFFFFSRKHNEKRRVPSEWRSFTSFFTTEIKLTDGWRKSGKVSIIKLTIWSVKPWVKSQGSYDRRSLCLLLHIAKEMVKVMPQKNVSVTCVIWVTR